MKKPPLSLLCAFAVAPFLVQCAYQDTADGSKAATSVLTRASALTPIAQTDVVPYQRIEYGASFNFGVVAFSKAGIDRVDFAISGQGYSGGTKTSSSMTLNTRVASASPGAVRSGVWEYHVTISASEFSSNGLITVTPTVYGGDGGIRSLAAVRMYVEGASDASPTEAWVDPWDNDGTGTLNDDTDPYPTIAAAIAAIESANGDCDYSTIYLAEGSYDNNNEFGSGDSVGTTTEWLIVTKESGASTENVIFLDDNAVWGSGRIKFDSVTFSGPTTSNIALSRDGVWLNKCRIIGPGVEVAGSFPTRYEDYVTSCYYHNTAIINDTQQKIYRGNKVEDTYDDFGRYLSTFIDGILVINNEVDGVRGNPDGSQSHSDVFQADAEIHNIIYFCNIFTKLQYQSFFMDSDGSSSNIAIVNNLFEFETAGSPNRRGWVFDQYDHLLFWHNTHSGRGSTATLDNLFYTADRCTSTPGDVACPGGGIYRTNESHIGNVWDRHAMNGNAVTSLGWDYLDSGNSDGNEAKYNHYMKGTTFGENYTTGTGVIDFDTPGSATFGYPVEDSVLIDAMPSNLTGVPCDAYGNIRDSRPDVGALESGSRSVTFPLKTEP